MTPVPFDQVRPGESSAAVIRQLGKADLGPQPFTTPIGTVVCIGWRHKHMLVCFDAAYKAVYIGQYAPVTNKLVREKGDPRLLSKPAAKPTSGVAN